MSEAKWLLRDGDTEVYCNVIREKRGYGWAAWIEPRGLFDEGGGSYKGVSATIEEATKEAKRMAFRLLAYSPLQKLSETSGWTLPTRRGQKPKAKD